MLYKMLFKIAVVGNPKTPPPLASANGGNGGHPSSPPKACRRLKWMVPYSTGISLTKVWRAEVSGSYYILKWRSLWCLWKFMKIFCMYSTALQEFFKYTAWAHQIAIWILTQILYSEKLCPRVPTTPLRQWGFRQCLPFSWTTLL